MQNKSGILRRLWYQRKPGRLPMSLLFRCCINWKHKSGQHWQGLSSVPFHVDGLGCSLMSNKNRTWGPSRIPFASTIINPVGQQVLVVPGISLEGHSVGIVTERRGFEFCRLLDDGILPVHIPPGPGPGVWSSTELSCYGRRQQQAERQYGR